MIHSFSFSNFTSFQDETTIDFTISKKDPTNDGTSSLLSSGIQVSKFMTLIWPNASGKSNLLKVLAFLRFFLIDAYQLPIDASLSQFLQPFRLMDELDQIITLSCIFETNDIIYEISLTLNDGFVTSETLRMKTRTESRYTWKTIYDRKKSSKEFRKNASLLFTLERDNDKLSHEILNYWRKISSNIPLVYQPFKMNGIATSMHYYIQNPHELERINELIKKFDFGIKIKIKKSIDSDNYTFQAIHEINGKEYDSGNLSDGTINMISIMPMIFSTLDTGWMLIFDELDANLHPEVVEAILDLFASKKYNEHNAQIFFSTHDPRVMNRLFKYQIQLVEKNTMGVSHSWRLDEMKGVRVEDNYYTKYMAWAYQAKPNITL